jgi:hypothetical protein
LVLFPLKLIAVSFIMAWLTLCARSFWPAVLLHGSGNGIGVGVMSSLTFSVGVTSLTATVAQIGLTVAIAILCLVLTSLEGAELNGITAASNCVPQSTIVNTELRGKALASCNWEFSSVFCALIYAANGFTTRTPA